MRISGFSFLALMLTLGCGIESHSPSFEKVAPVPHRLVVWLGSEGLDIEAAENLQRIGVDEVVVRRGSVNLAGSAPVLRFLPAPEVVGAIPVGIVLDISGVRDDLDKGMAEAMWRGIQSELGEVTPAELILDLPRIAEGLDLFILDLIQVAGVPVVPILGFQQLQQEKGQGVARAARGCIVPAYGTDNVGLRGVRELDPLPLAKKLEPLADSGIRIRLAISLQPRTEPLVDNPIEDLNALTENQVATVSTSSTLDRNFVFRKELSWCGRTWQTGESVAVRWMDAARLHRALREINMLVLPEVAGWDLVSFPNGDHHLGLNRESLVAYLGGDGPVPDLELEVVRSGQSLEVILRNKSPFTSAVSSFGNWVQISLESGRPVVDDPGTFDQVALGVVQGSNWQVGGGIGINAVRFNEVFVAAGEELTTGPVRLPSSRTKVDLLWNLILTDGTQVSGRN